jgi:hypothetical protein
VKWSPQLPRREILIVAGLCLLAFVTTLAVLGSQTAARNRRRAEVRLQTLEKTQKPALTAEELSLTPDDFLLPRIEPLVKTPQYEPFRPRLVRWSPQMVEKFWIAPRDIAIEIVSSLNDQRIRHLFETTP